MRLLIWSDAGVHTGFGAVTQAIGDRLVLDHGWDVHTLALNYRGDHWPTAMKLYPATLVDPQDIFGYTRIVELVGKIVPDAVLLINDPHVVLNSLVNNAFDPNRVLWQGYQVGDLEYRPPILAYMPIDGYDSPRSWDLLTERVTRIAMTHFGRETMPEAPVVWHGVDPNVFHLRDRADAKRELGFDPDRFLALRVDKNSTRKDYPATWKALKPLLRKYRDIDVHFHCLARAFDGYDLNALRFNDEDIRDRVTFSPHLTGYTGWTNEQLATLHAAADVFISTSWGEGFGLNNLNSIACGTPVIAQDCSANREVIGPGGVLIPPKDRISTPMGQDQCLPDIARFSAEIEHLYQAAGVRRKLGAAGAEHAKQFSWDWAAARFDQLLRGAIGQPVPDERIPAGVS